MPRNPTSFVPVTVTPPAPPAASSAKPSIWTKLDDDTEALELYEGTTFTCTLVWHKGAMTVVGARQSDIRKR